MSILIDDTERVIIQGISGDQGQQQLEQLSSYGTNIVGGVVPGKSATSIGGVPVYETVSEAVEVTNATASLILVPPQAGSDAIMEALDSELKLAVAITEGIPVQETLKIKNIFQDTDTTLIGPNCPGIISPNKSSLCIFPGDIFSQGNVGIVSRSGTLMLKLAQNLSQHEIGQSTAVGIGGDPVVGTSMQEIVRQFENDPQTDIIVLCGEIGGHEEENTAKYIDKNVSTPVIGYIVGRSAPKGRQMGHAGAIVSGSQGGAESKIEALRNAGVTVCERPPEIVEEIKSIRKND